MQTRITGYQDIGQNWRSNSASPNLRTAEVEHRSSLDGGRVLRTLVSRSTVNNNRSKHIAAQVGQFVATLFIVWGIFHIFFGMGLGGLCLFLIGWILLRAAKASYPKIPSAKILSPLCVGEVMRRDCETVSASLDLQAFVNRYVLRTRKRYYFVAENDMPAGLISTEQVKNIPCEQWPTKTVSQVMSTLDDIQIVNPQMPIAKAYETMVCENLNQLPVASNHELAGIITRDD